MTIDISKFFKIFKFAIVVTADPGANDRLFKLIMLMVANVSYCDNEFSTTILVREQLCENLNVNNVLH